LAEGEGAACEGEAVGHGVEADVRVRQGALRDRGADQRDELRGRRRGAASGVDAGAAGEINRRLALLKRHLPYHESDHVLNIAYNMLCESARLEGPGRPALQRSLTWTPWGRR